MSAGALSLERYAEIRAELDAGKLRDDVLAYVGIDVDTWAVEQQQWLEKMSTELERGRFELTNRYTKAFVDRQLVLQEASSTPSNSVVSPPIAALPLIDETPLGLSSLSSSTLGEALVVASASSEPGANRYAPPSAMQASNGLPAVIPAPSFAETLAPIPTAADAKPLPFHAATKPSFVVSEVLPPAMLEQTKKSASVQVVEPARFDAADDAGQTMFGALPGGPALPFQSGDAQISAMRVFPPPNQARDEELSDEDLAGMTSFVSMPVVSSLVLPFQTKSPPSTKAEDSGSCGSFSLPNPNTGSRSGAHAPPVPPSKLPIVEATPALAVETDLHHYASLCAELSTWPQHTEAVFARYGLVRPEKRKAVDDTWKERMRKDPALYAQWQQLFRASVDRLRRG